MESKFWPFILTFVQQWKQIGFGMLLYLASILGIDKTYYEAAMLDGATKWQQIKKYYPAPVKANDHYAGNPESWTDLPL